MPLDTSIKKVLVIGSGPIVIGQAAEFDYAGAQACRILKEAGVEVVLCNSNPATIMTDQAMGQASLDAKKLPTTLKEAQLVDYPVEIGEKLWRITCVDMGNPHCVVFCQRVDGVDVPVVGPQFEHAEIFPERINTEFIRVVNESTIKMRVWERGSGETMITQKDNPIYRDAAHELS